MAPAADGASIACGIAGGDSLSGVRCHRDLPAVEDARALVMRTRFWLESEGLEGEGPAGVHGLALGTSQRHGERRWELALRWRREPGCEPGWYYWDPRAAEPWVSLGISQTLRAEHWHSLEIWGAIEPKGGARYERIVIDGEEHPLDLEVSATMEPGEADRLSVAVQVDGNDAERPHAVVLDQLDLEWHLGERCEDASTFYRDADGDGFGVEGDAVVACEPPAGYVSEAGDCDDDDSLMAPGSGLGLDFDPLAVGTPLWPGLVADPDDWQTFTSAGSMLVLGVGPGLVMGYELPENAPGVPEHDWVVARRELPGRADLGAADFLLVPMQGSSGAAPRTLEVKLQDANGCMAIVPLTELTGLTPRRTAVIAMERFASCGTGSSTDLGSIVALEIGISEVGPGGPSADAASGHVMIDDIHWATAEELRRPTSAFECVPPQGDVMGRIADRFVLEQGPSGLIRTWFPESPGSYNAYAQAMALIVLSLEHGRTGQGSYAQAATAIASQLVALQDAYSLGGEWADLYVDGPGGQVVPATGPWVGSHAWVMIGLRVFLDEVAVPDPTGYQAALSLGASWLDGERVAYSGGTGGVTSGTEGNVSTYFALRAAGEEPLDLADYLMAEHWDSEDQWLRMGSDYWGIALDVVCNWGAELLRDAGYDAEALATCGLASGIFPVRSFDDLVSGLGDIAGPWQPTVEFTAQYSSTGGRGQSSSSTRCCCSRTRRCRVRSPVPSTTSRGATAGTPR